MKHQEIFDLAKECEVSMNSACIKSGIPVSTPHRWTKGSTPKEVTLERLRTAIIILAYHAGTLPERLDPEAKELLESESSRDRERIEQAQELARNIHRDSKKLAKVLNQ